MQNARPLVFCDEMQQVMLCCLHLARSEDIWIMAVNLYRCQQHNLIVLYVCDRIDPESSVSEYLRIGSQWLFLNHSRQDGEGGCQNLRPRWIVAPLYPKVAHLSGLMFGKLAIEAFLCI